MFLFDWFKFFHYLSHLNPPTLSHMKTVPHTSSPSLHPKSSYELTPCWIPHPLHLTLGIPFLTLNVLQYPSNSSAGEKMCREYLDGSTATRITLKWNLYTESSLLIRGMHSLPYLCVAFHGNDPMSKSAPRASHSMPFQITTPQLASSKREIFL